MTRGLFILGEILRASFREWPRWLGFSAAVALVLASGSAVVLLQGGSEKRGGGAAWVTVAYISEEVSDPELNQLGWDLWKLEGVKRVSFRFAGDELPGGGVAESRALLIWTNDEAVASSLKEEISRLAQGKVTSVEIVALHYPSPARLPPLSRVISLVALVFFAFVSLVLVRSAAVRTLDRWRNEWNLLRFSGIEPWVLAGNFVGTVVLWGLMGCILYVLVYLGLRGAVGGFPGVREVAPGYITSEAFPYLVGFIIGPIWAALAGVLSLLLSGTQSQPEASEI